MTINSNWQAALIVLDAPAIRDRAKKFCDYQLQRIKPEISDIDWTISERSLIDLALSLNSDHRVSLREVLGGIESRDFRRVHRAIGLVINNEASVMIFDQRSKVTL